MPQYLQCTKGGKTALLQEQSRCSRVVLPLRHRTAESATNRKRQDAGAPLSLEEGNGRVSPISYWNGVASLQQQLFLKIKVLLLSL